MVHWFRKKKDETIKEPPKTACNCEICRFSNQVEKRIGQELYKLTSPFIWLPSRVRNINPEKALEEAMKYESTGDINSAISSYNEAFVGALAKEDIDITKYLEACTLFFEKNEKFPTGYRASIENYRNLLNRPDILTALRESYIDFIRAIPEPEKK